MRGENKFTYRIFLVFAGIGYYCLSLVISLVPNSETSKVLSFKQKIQIYKN
jgi:hypothetical protein